MTKASPRRRRVQARDEEEGLERQVEHLSVEVKADLTNRQGSVSSTVSRTAEAAVQRPNQRSSGMYTTLCLPNSMTWRNKESALPRR
jgi:hypothetical protein